MLCARALTLVVITTLARDALAQLVVTPRRANQNRVRYFGFDWATADILVHTASRAFEISQRSETAPDPLSRIWAEQAAADELPDEETSARTAGGIRLFFHDREQEVAEHVAAIVEAEYRHLVRKFRHVPRRTFPYVLYSTYQEFLQTNLFPVQEGTLGVTSPIDLTLTLPYFGDDRLFRRVSTHELVHQFTIQKVRDVAEAVGIGGDPLSEFPLWFIEGLAEYYAFDGVDDETAMLVRDLIVNPDPNRGYVNIDYFADRPGSFLWTYKVGQVRCAFLEDTYGRGTLQAVLEASGLLVGDAGKLKERGNFAELLQFVTGDPPDRLQQRYDAWIRRQAYSRYLATSQDIAEFDLVDVPVEILGALATSPSGRLLMYRTIELETGRSRLVLFDSRAPEDSQRVAVDGLPGVESLHPADGRNFALADDALVYVAEAQGADVIYWRKIEHRATPPAEADEGWDIDIDLGDRRALSVREHGINAVSSLALSPDAKKIAFIGLDGSARRDVYVASLREDGFDLERITRDVHAERTVSWGPGGIVFNSEATGHGKYNLFRATTSSITRLTSEDRDHLDPIALPDGRVLFVATEDGRANLYEVSQGAVALRTHINTGLFEPSPGVSGGVWGLLHHSGRRRIAHLAKDKLLSGRPSVMPEPSAPVERESRSLENAAPYHAWDLGNWRIDNVFALLGAGGGGLAGQLFLTSSDRLRDHSIIANVTISGDIELTDGFIIYVDQSRRLTWGGGPFQWLRFRVDGKSLDNGQVVLFGERFFGGRGILHYPLDRFSHLQAEIAAGGVKPVSFTFLDQFAGQSSGPTEFQSEITLRAGFSTIRYHPATGPLDGTSLLLETTGGYRPDASKVYGLVRLDAEKYFPIIGRSNVFLRGSAGGSSDGDSARQFYLSSPYTLRGVDFDNLTRLLGRYYFYSTAELQIPLNAILRFALFTDLEGIAGADFGAVADNIDALWDRRILDLVAGLNLGLGPFVLRLHFAWPIDIGAPVPGDGSVVTNFSLGWVYF